MIQGVIFDADGVLLDSNGIWIAAGSRYLQGLGISPAPELGRILWEMSLPEGALYLKNTYSLPFSDEEIQDGVIRTVRDFYAKQAPLKPGVFELLTQLSRRNVPMVIATAGDTHNLTAALKHLGISRFFKGIVTPAEAGSGKNSPSIYRMAAAMLGTAPQNTLVFEDALYALKTAKAAGFLTVGVYDRFCESEQTQLHEAADVYCKSFTDILHLIEIHHSIIVP